MSQHGQYIMNNNPFINFRLAYLTYTADSAQTIKLNLVGTNDYSLEVIDTWNMNIVSEDDISSGDFLYQTKFPYTALRVIFKK